MAYKSRWTIEQKIAIVMESLNTNISVAEHSLAQRKGKQVAAVAAARKLLLCCYSILRNRRQYYDQAQIE
ncbi:MAG: hypothetical protein ACRECH_06495 [Nitrososphaerales archaeon]